MSTPRVDQPVLSSEITNNNNDFDKAPFGSKRESLVLNLFSKGHQCSSVTTTTTKRRPTMRTLGKSLGGAGSGSSPPEQPSDRRRLVGQSPLDDLRECLARAGDERYVTLTSHSVHDDRASSFEHQRPSSPSSSRHVQLGAKQFVASSHNGTSGAQPNSAPATLFHSGHHRLVVEDEEDEAEATVAGDPLETTATIKLQLPRDSPSPTPIYDCEILTKANDNDSSITNCANNLLQVVELDDDSLTDQRFVENGEDTPTTTTRPIIEVKQTSSSASSSSTSSGGSSPDSSRQSSDCERRRVEITSRRTSNSKQQQQQSAPSHHNSPGQPDPSASAPIRSSPLSPCSSSSSLSSSSSRKLIRRRTVRRSYHSRALEDSAEQTTHQQKPLVVTTTTTESSEILPTRCRSAEPEIELENDNSNNNSRETSTSASLSSSRNQNQKYHTTTLSPSSSSTSSTKIQSTTASKLSTSRSSSKIATITTSSSSTTNHHHLKKCSTTSKQTVNKTKSHLQEEEEQQQKNDMTTASSRQRPVLGGTQTNKLDLSASNLLLVQDEDNDDNNQMKQESLFERRNRTAMMSAGELARSSTTRAATCLALKRKEEQQQEEASSSTSSSSIRKSSEQSSSTMSFNASSSSLTKSTKSTHQSRHLAEAAAAAAAGLASDTVASVVVAPTSATAISSSSTSSSSCETSLSRSATSRKTASTLATSGVGRQMLHHQQQQQADLASSSHFRTYSASTFMSAAAQASKQKRSFLASPDNLLLSSPDVRSLVQELGSDFAELESAMTASSSLTVREQFATRSTNGLTSRLFGALPPPPAHPQAITGRLTYRIEQPPPLPSPRSNNNNNNGPDSLESLLRETNSTIKELEDNPPDGDFGSAGGWAHQNTSALRQSADELANNNNSSSSSLVKETTGANQSNGAKIRELMDKVQRHRLDSGNGGTVDNSSSASLASLVTSGQQQANDEPVEIAAAYQQQQAQVSRSPLNENEAVKGKIERIDQRMNDLCRKLESCNDTQKAIELLKIMIQTIEKAWSIPVCGDDLGFKLCNSLRQFGGLDMILGFIHEADARLLLQEDNDTNKKTVANDKSLTSTGPLALDQNSSNNNSRNNNTDNKASLRPARQLKLNLSKIQQNSEEAGGDHQNHHDDIQQQAKEDEDSDMLTSDLGLDSTTSVDSLSYVSARTAPEGAPSSQHGATSATSATSPSTVIQTPPASDDSIMGSSHEEVPLTGEHKEGPGTAMADEDEPELRRAREEELVLLSAHLLSQCLTSENRDYIVKFGLDPVIKLACQFTTMKSRHSKRLLKRSALMRQSSTMKQLKQQQLAASTAASVDHHNEAGSLAERDVADTATSGAKRNQNDGVQGEIVAEPGARKSGGGSDHHDRSDDMHSAIGTEILHHLFKHSEETCSRMINLGALQAILYGCRSSHVETLRHCASALANLALYGGPDSQQTMVEQKAHVWLFPLAFNEDDNVQYYACLAIVVLAANQEIEADVLKSSTLDLVEPFVTSHEPRKFAESTTSHIHGQSANWLRKLMPLLDSKREEARNLACFHFAMEAHIKREQGQTHLFKEIGSIEPLRRAGSSPIAIASKFACQALRLIGEPEPHKLSQQVPLWTCDDVCEWVAQVGFERFAQAFRESHVDGDLLLQLDEEMLRFDIGIENGIIRRRFLRELGQLKRIADYSSVDKSNLGQLLISSTSLMSPGNCSVLAGHNNHNNNLNNNLNNNSLNNQQPAHHRPHHLQHHHLQQQQHHHQQQQLCDLVGSGGASSSTQMLAHPTTATSSTNSAQARSARDYLQYIYPIIQLGVTRDNIHLVDCDQLLAECRITNALHRIKLANSIRELQERVMLEAASNERNSLGGADQKTLDVFVSYRRSTGSQLASLLKVHLQLRGFSVFIDVERLEAGKFDNNLLESIRMAKNFILVLSPNALDRCIGDHECKDWVHKEIVAALASNCNIIPIIDNFHWPDPEQLPEDMRSVSYFNGIRWIHDYQDACVDKVERFIRGELSNSNGSQTTTAGCPSTISLGSAAVTTTSGATASACGGQQTAPVLSPYSQRFGYSSAQTANCVSTPSIATTASSNLSLFNGGAASQNSCATHHNLHLNSHHNHSNMTNGGNIQSISSMPMTSIPTTTTNNNNSKSSSSSSATNHDHQPNSQEPPPDSAPGRQPLANSANPYLNCTLNCGNVNPNIRLR
uniref:ADP-ribosyl cyclase/cyclic ADP-ribose hydrolase n=1 Tax=Aceria tosichella TaxID=561515 RepID=A0A6G1S8W9_9ACAR